MVLCEGYPADILLVELLHDMPLKKKSKTRQSENIMGDRERQKTRSIIISLRVDERPGVYYTRSEMAKLSMLPVSFTIHPVEYLTPQ